MANEFIARNGLIAQNNSVISGSLNVTSGITGSFTGSFTGSLQGTASWASNAITSLNSLTGATQTFATGSSGTDFAISSAGTTHTFNLPNASAINRGLLSSANWSTFNNKLGSTDIGITVQGYNASTTLLGNTTTGGGSTIVLGTSPTFTTSIITPTVTGVNGALTFTNTAQSSGAITDYTFTSAAHTSQNASAEIIGVNYNLSATLQHAAGAITTQRDFLIQARTHSFVGASTITSAGTLVVSAAPIAGTNATITNRYSIWSQSGNVYFQDSNATNFRFGDAGGGNAGISAVWLDQAAGQSSTNWTIGQNGTNSYLNTGTGGIIYIGVASVETLTISSTTMTMIDAKNIAVGTSTGTKIGTATTQKLAFFNSTPIVQPASTVEVGTALSNLGLRAAGVASFSGSFTGSISMPARSAFRVTGSNSTDITAVTTFTSTNGIGIDYNQGSNYNNTTGIYTAPLAGLYHVYMNIRVGSVNSQMQVIMYKNDTATQLMWEAPGTAASTHFGVSGIVSLAANDNLRVKVTVGKVQFDSNDSWGAAYIG